MCARRASVVPGGRGEVSVSKLPGPSEVVVVPSASIRSRHSIRRLTYLEEAQVGFRPQTTGGVSLIVVSGPPGKLLCRLPLVRRSILHELAHCIHNVVQASGIPYSGRDPRHAVREIRNAPFAYVEGEPQAFLSFLDHVVPRDPSGRDSGLSRRGRRPGRFVRRILTANQLLRSELACGWVLGSLLVDPRIGAHYLPASFYRIVAPAYPELAGRRLTKSLIKRVISPSDNGYIRYQYVRLKHDPGNVMEFLRAYLAEFPCQRVRAMRLIARRSAGLLLSEDAGRRNLAGVRERILAGLGVSRPDPVEARRGARERAAWICRLARETEELVGDVRTPMVIRTSRGVIDLNRSGGAEIAHVLGIDRGDAQIVVANRRELRAGEYLDLLDLVRPRSRALHPGATWRELSPSTYGLLLAKIHAASISESPFSTGYGFGTTTGSVKPSESQTLDGM
jgi:hypothetical protein